MVTVNAQMITLVVNFLLVSGVAVLKNMQCAVVMESTVVLRGIRVTLVLAGEYGCCPLPDATCCGDGHHCCPDGYKCASDACTKLDSVIPMVSKQPSIKKNVICPDGQSECPSDDTCCKLSSGQWGCCPQKHAVCCSDGKHCCPEGYKCDTGAGTCTKSDSVVPMVSKQPSIKNIIPSLEEVGKVICPDNSSKCRKGNTCCKLATEQWGCCPMKHAVCCRDGEFCCPKGYECGTSSSAFSCTKSDSVVPMSRINLQ